MLRDRKQIQRALHLLQLTAWRELAGHGVGGGNLGRAQGTPGVKELELESKETKAERVCRAEHFPGEGYIDKFL